MHTSEKLCIAHLSGIVFGKLDSTRHPRLAKIVADPLCSVVIRLYPVVPGNARIAVEDEIVVGDYLFPKKVRHSSDTGRN